MTEFFIIIIAIWFYPILGYLFFRFTKSRLEIGKNILKVISFLAALAILGLSMNISTTLTELDWLIVTMPFLLLCTSLWWSQFQKKNLIKYLGIAGMVLFFGFSYFIGSVGILGVGFGVGHYVTEYEKWYDNGLIYKEASLGNAISDFRGKSVEIYKTLEWFPLVEWRIEKEEYYNLTVYRKALDVKYDKGRNQFILQAEDQRGDSTYYWTEQITLNQ